MNSYDDELQRDIEAGRIHGNDDHDARIYERLFKGLSKPPVIDIPSTFTDKVLARIIAQKAQRSTRDLVWLGVGVLMLSLVCVIAFAYSGIQIEVSTLKHLAGIGGLALFFVVFCGLLTVVDKKLIVGKLDSKW